MMFPTGADETVDRQWRGTALAVLWEWLARPTHYRAVRKFRMAAQRGDVGGLASMLAPEVAVVVDAGVGEDRPIRVVSGAYDAVALLSLGLAEQSGTVAVERSVNGQAGIVVSRNEQASAAITVDFTGHLISVVWIRLHPEMLRHWMTV
jgi:RNA polymerase sigma-70 factor (ECF subfamily)